MLADQLRTLRRVGLVMCLLSAAGVILAVGALLGDKREVAALAKSNYELTQRVNRLTAEVALKEARFQAAKGLMQGTDKLASLLTIQQVLDRYALEELHNGNSQGKTADDVRREACERLSGAGFPCLL